MARAPVAQPPEPRPPRSGSDADHVFLRLLGRIPGFTVADHPDATTTARHLCVLLGRGETPGQATALTVQHNPGMTPAQAAAAVNAAITAYCPMYLR